MSNACKVYAGNLSWNTDEDALRQYFGAAGVVVEAVVMREPGSNRSRGFGFVFQRLRGFQRHRDPQRDRPDGRRLRVNVANQPQRGGAMAIQGAYAASYGNPYHFMGVGGGGFAPPFDGFHPGMQASYPGPPTHFPSHPGHHPNLSPPNGYGMLSGAMGGYPGAGMAGGHAGYAMNGIVPGPGNGSSGPSTPGGLTGAQSFAHLAPTNFSYPVTSSGPMPGAGGAVADSY